MNAFDMGADGTCYIRNLHSMEEFGQVVELQKQVWGWTDSEAVPAHVLHAVARAGGQVMGVFCEKIEDHTAAPTSQHALCAFALALPAFGPDGERYLISHMTAVRPELQSKGLGYKLKMAQRKDALAKGIKRITWTFDPLISKNAQLNIAKLGACVYRFEQNVYGDLRSNLYGRVATDRFEVTWHLHRSDCRDLDTQVPRIVSGSINDPHLEVGMLAQLPDVFRLPIPRNHLELRQTVPDVAGRWFEIIRRVGITVLDHSSPSGESLRGSHFVGGFRYIPEEDCCCYFFFPRDGHSAQPESDFTA